MRGAWIFLAVLLAIPATMTLRADEPADKDLAKKPITSAQNSTGNLLRAWWKEGTASGNVGDRYDNRDRGHSEMDLERLPQLRKVVYSKAELDARRDWGLQPRVLPGVVFGNSSTSAPPLLGGSNVRAFYCSRQGLEVLQQQYLKNNLYIYPEHRDHDPGRNGVPEGFGDVYPTNTPYLITSQGSSGSDNVFMQVVGFTLAAIRPEVKKKLVETGLLMPTLQMLLRTTNNHLTYPSDYYLGKAHPTAFEPARVDAEKLIDRAHAIRLTTIPPMVKLDVVEEDKPVAGEEFFEPSGVSEQHGDTGSVIARIWRGHKRSRRIVVSAAKSFDVNKYPLKYRWEVLRGDEKRIRIKPRDKTSSAVEITLDYHERRPVAPGSPLESNRVDIGVFVHNGVYPSAPGFVTFYSLDNEARDYDDKGRIVAIGYGMGFTELKVPDHGKVVTELSREGLATNTLGLTTAQRQELEKVGKQLATLPKEPDRGKALDARRESLGASVRQFVETTLDRAVKTPLWWNDHREMFLEADKRPDREQYQARLNAARRKLLQLGIAVNGPGKALKLQPARTGSGKPLTRLSAFERAMLEEFNARLLTELVLPGLVTATFHANYVDPRLTASKSWHDVYEYAGDQLIGWKRYHVGETNRVSEFTREGWVVVAKDAKGRATKARTVFYGQKPLKAPNFANTNPLESFPGPEEITFEYEGEKRKIKSREKVVDTLPG